MFSVGDIVQCYSPIAGKKKFHLCVCGKDESGIYHFLFLNSHDGFEADCVFNDKQIPCLPESKTGISVVSCSLVVRYNEKQLAIYNAKKLGELTKDVATHLHKHVLTVKSLSNPEKKLVLASIESLL